MTKQDSAVKGVGGTKLPFQSFILEGTSSKFIVFDAGTAIDDYFHLFENERGGITPIVMNWRQCENRALKRPRPAPHFPRYYATPQ
jgi:hypothetical protein